MNREVELCEQGGGAALSELYGLSCCRVVLNDIWFLGHCLTDFASHWRGPHHLNIFPSGDGKPLTVSPPSFWIGALLGTSCS